MESVQSAVVGTNWQSEGHLATMMEGRRYDRSVTDLLRLIRNKGEHYSSLPSYIKQCLGHPLEDPETFLGYFSALFPGLIAWTWHCMYEFRQDANLRAFYPENGSYLARVPIEKIISD
jgi:Ribonuclease 2-5A